MVVGVDRTEDWLRCYSTYLLVRGGFSGRYCMEGGGPEVKASMHHCHHLNPRCENNCVFLYMQSDLLTYKVPNMEVTK